ncbi:leucine-rich repeat-containing protein (LRR) [Tieghemostelium lacteum]|uniref:Leucine-rich repeat-containing protein (LRR) n=1 Tax=Tieghemostelium lacteum TaxID=361077 RepID=A0A151ZS34_TIELA|nr:leucine-rich repeat-containing protein (LRR) [Tieghemostelium lacteum]|eukprot:KYQ96831.1 leucine-rich repeat-containing protein (LRR) [Tieghemostelium lacteum]
MNYDIVTDDIQKFVEEQLKQFHLEKKRIIEWVDSRSLKSKRFKKRIIVLANYRILSIKRGKLNISLNKNIHIYDITDLIVVEDTVEIRQKQTIGKAGDQNGILIKTHKELLQNLIYNIREIHRRISHNFPESLQLKINASYDYLIKLPEKQIGMADNFIEIYRAQSNFRNTTPSPEVCRLVEKYVHDGQTDFDLTKCPGVEVRSDLNFNIETLLLSLKYNTYFQAIIINGINQKNILQALGDVILTNCYIRKVSLTNIQEEQSLSTIGQGLIQNPFHFVQVVDLSYNHINQNTFVLFCEGIESLRHALKYLNLSNCNLHSRSVELLFNSLSRNLDLSKGIEYFNVSHNKFEDIGSTTCSNWLEKIKDVNSLKSLYISCCALNLLILGVGLRVLHDLKSLDISQNRLEKTEIEQTVAILQLSRGIESLDVSNCQLANEFFVYIANTISKNLKIKQMSLYLANNYLGKNINSLVNAFEFLSNLHTLDLSCNAIGYKGLTRTLDSLRKNEFIHTVKLDQNFSGSPNEGLEFIYELKNFLTKKPSVKSLSLGGSGSTSTISAPLMTQFLDFLCTNVTLEELQINGNYLGDSMATSIANLMESNPVLKSLELDKNNFTINAFQTFLLSLQNNHHLVNIPFPTHDFEKAYSSLPSVQKKSLLFTVLLRIQNILNENGQWTKPDQHYYPTPASKIIRNIDSNGNTSGSSPSGSFTNNNNNNNNNQRPHTVYNVNTVTNSSPSKSTNSTPPLPQRPKTEQIPLGESFVDKIENLNFDDIDLDFDDDQDDQQQQQQQQYQYNDEQSYDDYE